MFIPKNFPMEIHTDVSGYGLGAVLVQRLDGEGHVISYASRTLTKAECNYFTTKKECLAAIWQLRNFVPAPFASCLRWSRTTIPYVGSQAWKTPVDSWGTGLQSYNVAVTYKSGKIQIDADCLSHHLQPVTPCTSSLDTGVIVGPIDDMDIIAAQAQDSDLCQII